MKLASLTIPLLLVVGCSSGLVDSAESQAELPAKLYRISWKICGIANQQNVEERGVCREEPADESLVSQVLVWGEGDTLPVPKVEMTSSFIAGKVARIMVESRGCAMLEPGEVGSYHTGLTFFVSHHHEVVPAPAGEFRIEEIAADQGVKLVDSLRSGSGYIQPDKCKAFG